MAKGDNLGPSLGWNPGGMRMGGQASFGSRPMPNPQMNPNPMMGSGGNGNMAGLLGGMGAAAGSIAPSQGMGQGIGQAMGQMGMNAGQMMNPQVQPMRAQGPMVPPSPQQGQGIAPGFNPMEAIQRMIGMRTQGTSSTTPIQPNSYAINPSANVMSNNRQQQ
jgi:hypothetical protein